MIYLKAIIIFIIEIKRKRLQGPPHSAGEDSIVCIPGITEGDKDDRDHQYVHGHEWEVDFALPLAGVALRFAFKLLDARFLHVSGLDEDEELGDGEDEGKEPGQRDELLGCGRGVAVLQWLADGQVPEKKHKK